MNRRKDDMPNNNNDALDIRWRNRMDEDVSNLTERMAGVESSVQNVGGSVDRLTHLVERSFENQSDNAKTKWPVIFGALSLVLIIIGGFMGGYVRDLNRIEANVSFLDRNNADISHIKSLDEDLRREMSMLQNTSNIRIEALEDKFNNIIRLSKESYDRRLADEKLH